MVPLIGYLDRFSVRPGERVAVKVSSALGESYAADLVRIRHADPNPAGPGMRLLPVPAPWAGRYASRAQSVRGGSCALLRGAPLELGASFTLLLRAQPWKPDDAPRAVLALRDADGRALVLRLGPQGAVCELDGTPRCALAAPPLPRSWYEIALTVSPGRLTLAQRPLRPSWGAADFGTAAIETPEADAWHAPLDLIIASETDAPRACFNGRIEDPLLLRGAHPEATLDDPEALLGGGDVLAWWDFSEAIETDRLHDRGPQALHARLHNMPARGMRGSRWTGREHCWRHASRDYAAIHFHDDDLEDCGWETDFEAEIPPGLPSGVYGIRLRAAGQEDIIPLFVAPPRGVARAPIAYLAATFTYQVYANYLRGNHRIPAWRERRDAWPDAYRHVPDEHREYGLSTYNHHPDGSGIHMASRLRPILSLRPGYLAIPDARGSGLRHLQADSHLTDWMEEKGLAYDVITDEDLDAEGVELLRRYRCVVTGSHPEYHTERTLDALQSYTAEGGRLAYLGGNGFYWKVARRLDRPHLIEVRRAEGGIRAWAAEPGEYWHQLDGSYGGLWRRNGRPPQALAGVGFSGQGMFEGSYYRRLPASREARHAWIFEGIEDEIIGDFGLSGGGAAGFELDRADTTLGTPPNAAILARSEKHQDHFVTVPEELLTHLSTVTGEPPAALIRAEIVHFETAKGGAVFATGSITFCGSLSHNGYDNNVSRMLENVLRRFSAAD